MEHLDKVSAISKISPQRMDVETLINLDQNIHQNQGSVTTKITYYWKNFELFGVFNNFKDKAIGFRLTFLDESKNSSHLENQSKMSIPENRNFLPEPKAENSIQPNFFQKTETTAILVSVMFKCSWGLFYTYTIPLFLASCLLKYLAVQSEKKLFIQLNKNPLVSENMTKEMHRYNLFLWWSPRLFLIGIAPFQAIAVFYFTAFIVSFFVSLKKEGLIQLVSFSSGQSLKLQIPILCTYFFIGILITNGVYIIYVKLTDFTIGKTLK